MAETFGDWGECSIASSPGRCQTTGVIFIFKYVYCSIENY